MSPASLLSSLRFPLGVAANPVVIHQSPVTLSLIGKPQFQNGHDLLRLDLARAQALKNRALEESGMPGVFKLPVTNRAFSYVASVGVGSPPSYYDLVVDTGSSNTWVGARSNFRATRTTKVTQNIVKVVYGDKSKFFGVQATDTVRLAPGLIIPHQSIGICSMSEGFTDVDGVLGLGPASLARGTRDPLGIPTVTDNLFANGNTSGNTKKIGSYRPRSVVQIAGRADPKSEVVVIALDTYQHHPVAQHS